MAPHKNSQKCELRERGHCAPNFEERSQEETLHQERCARRAAWNLAKHIYKLKSAGKTPFYTPNEARVMPAPTSKRPEEREFVVDSGASKKNEAQMNWTVCEDPGTPPVVLTANGEVSTYKRGSTSIRSRFWPLRDSAITRRNACCCIDWKTLSYEWGQRSKNHG